MRTKVFLATPPFTQLNTPYPATAYLKGFLNTKGIESYQADLGIDVIVSIFSYEGLSKVFGNIISDKNDISDNARRIITLKDQYIHTIDATISFLQGNNPTLAHSICSRSFLPEASRFAQADEVMSTFGKMGKHDFAIYLATMYLEDLADLIQECLDPHFGFSRYAEHLGRSANSFDELYTSMQQPLTYIDGVLLSTLESKIHTLQPTIVGLSIPFPGNLYAALRCGQWLKTNHPDITIVMGGGFPNTELRSLSDHRVFEFTDFITLDDGEAPMEQIIAYTEGKIGREALKRTFYPEKGTVVYANNNKCADYRQGEVGTPDYTDLPLNKYISAIEIANPMHSMWSNGRWNKLTMAHGCYWGKCTFCDTSLDYIQRYDPLTAAVLCDKMETLIEQTGTSGFHFVDEAAPPALMRSLALEILRRKLNVTWWANIRFEKSFTRDLCLLLKASGCVAVSGGLEVASDRLLDLIQKGITVAQVAQVNRNFTDAGIMVHAYLMYGFPTQTAQETIDSLEMVRQMFQAGVLQSAFWHLFTMTAHSPVGLMPENFKVERKSNITGAFANNDVPHNDPTGTNHEQFAHGLRKSLHNYMHGMCLDFPLHKWFDFKVPRTSIPPDYIADTLKNHNYTPEKMTAKVVWLGNTPEVSTYTKSHKGNQWEMCSLSFHTNTQKHTIKLNVEEGLWLAASLNTFALSNPKLLTLQDMKNMYESAGLKDFELFIGNKPMNTMYKAGLLVL